MFHPRDLRNLNLKKKATVTLESTAKQASKVRRDIDRKRGVEGSEPKGWEVKTLLRGDAVAYVVADFALTPRITADDGSVRELPAIDITPFVLKWQSRFEYRNRHETGIVVRDIDKKPFERQIRTSTIRVMETADLQQVIVKGEVDAPAGTDVKTLVIDKQGRKSDVDIKLYLGAGRPCTSQGRKRVKTGFSAHVPRFSNLSCIIFYSDDATAARPAFFSIEQGFLERAKEDYRFDESFYRVLRIDRYQVWLQSIAAQGKREYPGLEENVTFSIIVPLYNTPIDFFREMYASVRDQSYSKWELLLVNASPENTALARELSFIDDPRVRIITLEENYGISGNTNAGLQAATGDYVCFFDHDDLLDLDVLSEYASVIAKKPETDVLYCDEDLFRAEDGRQTPQIKSDYNLELLRSCNYITHFLCVRRELAQDTPLNPDHDGAQDYDMVLRLSEKTSNFEHVAKMLYHWRVHSNSTAQSADNKEYAVEAGRSALEEHMARVGIPGHAENTPWPCFYRMAFDFEETPLVSIVIPNKDGASYLRDCVESIQEKTTWPNYEIVIVENNSETLEIFDLYKELEATYGNVRVVAWEHEFNYPKINNLGVEHAKGDYVVLLNNDTKVISPDWIQAMLGFCQQEGVGAVGAKLLYPDDTIQHAGIVIMSPFGPSSVAMPASIYQHHERDWVGLNRRCQLYQDLSAVTAACMMVSREDYLRVGGMSEEFAVAYNDIDFCFKLRREGLRVVYTPQAELYHLESVTRGMDDAESNPESYARFTRERGLLCAKWADELSKVDPFIGPIAQIII